MHVSSITCMLLNMHSPNQKELFHFLFDTLFSNNFTDFIFEVLRIFVGKPQAEVTQKLIKVVDACI